MEHRQVRPHRHRLSNLCRIYKTCIGKCQPHLRQGALIKHSSVFVSLSAFEGCPNTVMEAMACGYPQVLSDIPAHREILEESCSLFVDPSNIQQTADTIVKALGNPDASRARALKIKKN